MKFNDISVSILAPGIKNGLNKSNDSRITKKSKFSSNPLKIQIISDCFLLALSFSSCDDVKKIPKFHENPIKKKREASIS
mgnify:CR=1 FL=1